MPGRAGGQPERIEARMANALPRASFLPTAPTPSTIAEPRPFLVDLGCRCLTVEDRPRPHERVSESKCLVS
jgi:hypothetical protein